MKITVLTGAGISRESGLKTFRDEDGLWGGFKIEEVCTPQALADDPQRVLNFYNMRRREVLLAEPNAGHFALTELAQTHEVQIITQNIDDLHERAGSHQVHHLHGEVFKARSIANFKLVQEIKTDFNVGDLAPDGEQLRPHICFFHEIPFEWEFACEHAQNADLFLVIGTSLSVYPAAGLVSITTAPRVVLIDPNPPRGFKSIKFEIIPEIASVGVPQFVARLLEK